jgi:hypothetical protein
LEALDYRAAPATLAVMTDLAPLPAGADNAVRVGGTDGTAAGPQIVEFSGVPAGKGLYLFSGRVSGDQSGGLTVTLYGLPSGDKPSVTTNPDGTFSLLVPVPEGSGTTTVTAELTDADGNVLSDAFCDIDP